VAESLVDELTYRVRSTMGAAVFRQMPRRSFIIARLVTVGDEWMVSGPVQTLRAGERDVAYQLALDMSLRTPEAVFRNPAKVALGWEHQRADRARFVEFFGTDTLVVPGDQVPKKLDDYYTFCRGAVLGPEPADVPPAVSMSWPSDLFDADTVALIYDKTDGLGFYADFGLVDEAFTNPDLLRRRRWREPTRSYLEDDSVEPMVLRRLADRDPEKATVVFRRLLKRPRFDWNRDGEELLRTVKAAYYERPPRPRVSPLSERLTEFANRR
jgi:hypothetical protein